jgi:hypothetical protein
MAVDLRHRRPEALADPVLQRLDELALALQVVNFAEMQVNLDQLDERAHANIMPVLLQGLLDLPGLEELEDVALLDVGEALEHDPALLAFVDLGDVVLEATQ